MRTITVIAMVLALGLRRGGGPMVCTIQHARRGNELRLLFL
jgi:hypothetical protein